MPDTKKPHPTPQERFRESVKPTPGHRTLDESVKDGGGHRVMPRDPPTDPRPAPPRKK